KGVGGAWDWEKMSAWLANPKKFAPGTKMTFAGLSNPQDRADLMLWMNSKGGTLTVPPPPAATAEAPAGEDSAAAPAEGAASAEAPADGNEAAPAAAQ
ncbi:MAG TPA: cytochrome c family protein, partial [Sphingomicrobium sp.]|nr:cytochrome c family protein [Sphingomicrobium sp.]